MFDFALQTSFRHRVATLSLAVLAACGSTQVVLAAPQDVAEPATFPFASPQTGNNAEALLGRIQIGWTPPVDLTDLLWYEIMRVDLRDLSMDTVAAWSIPTTAMGPPAPIFCDVIDLTLPLQAPNAPFPLPIGRLPPVEPGEDPYPAPYSPGAGPNDGADYFLPPLVAAPPLDNPWGPTLELTAYRYYIRCVYDTNDDAPDPRFIASAWVQADGWRKVVIDLTPPPPIGPDVAGFNAVPGDGFWVTTPTVDSMGQSVPQNFFPFPNPVTDPGLSSPSGVTAVGPPDGPDPLLPNGGQLGCPLVGNRLRWSATQTTRKTTPDDPAGPPPFTCEVTGDIDAREDIDAFPNGAVALFDTVANLDGSVRFQFTFVGGGPSLNTGDPVTITLNGTAAPLVSGTEFFAVVEDINSFSIALTPADAAQFILITPTNPSANTATAAVCTINPGIGFPWRWRIERGYVSSGATAIDLPPDNVLTVYESPATRLPNWTGLGTIQCTELDVPRTFLYDDLFTAPSPPFCQLYYWYGVSRFIGLDSLDLYEVQSLPAVSVIDQAGRPILPIGHYLCTSVNLDVSGVVGGDAFAACTTVNPCAPAGTAVCLTDRVRVAWDTESQFIYSNYKIYRGVCLDGALTSMDLYVTVPGTTRVFSDFNVASDQVYSYSIQGFSPFSGSSQPTPVEMGYRLTAPSVTAATDGTSSTSVTVTIASPVGWMASSISVWRKQSGQSWPTTPLTAGTNLPGNATSFVDSTAVVGVVYVYAATAHSDSLDGDSIRGATNNGYLALSVPTGLAATTNLFPYVKLTWNYTGPTVAYEVYRRAPTATKFTRMTLTTALFYLDITATPGVTYEYKIRAKMINGVYSGYTSVVQGFRPTATPG